MVNVLVFLLTITSVNLTTATQSIERAFLQDSPQRIYPLLPKTGYIHISLPEPISFSDQISNQQTYYLFKNIFSSYDTFEFFPDGPVSTPEDNNYIFKARWSFQDKNNYKYVFYIFFMLIKTDSPTDDTSEWKILEIKAEKI